MTNWLQFNHRALAVATTGLAMGLWAWVRAAKPPIPHRAVLCMDLVLAVAVVQFGLG